MKFKFKGEAEIEINGKMQGFVWNMAALTKLGDLLNLSITKMAKEMVEPKFSFIAAFLYVGALYECKKKGENPSFTLEDASEWITEIGIERCMQLFNDAFTSPEIQEEKNVTAPEKSGLNSTSQNASISQ